MKINLTIGQTKMLSEFSSNFAIAWLVFSFISQSDYSIKSLSGILYGALFFVISFALAKDLK
jgi:hypothetical protein